MVKPLTLAPGRMPLRLGSGMFTPAARRPAAAPVTPTRPRNTPRPIFKLCGCGTEAPTDGRVLSTKMPHKPVHLIPTLRFQHRIVRLRSRCGRYERVTEDRKSV